MFFYARKKVFNTVGATVGLVSESITSKKTHNAESDQQQDADLDQDREEGERDSSELDEVQHDHERQWDLDEAQDRLLGAAQHSPSTNEPIDHAHLAELFSQQYPLPPSYERPFLPYPVVLPQRRPRTRARGFVRAYAPDLNAFGIDQDMFLDFVDRANQSCRGCEALGMLNFAALIAIPLGSPGIGMAISVVLQLAIKTTIAMDGRRKSNNFFDAANRDFFIPRGLFCLVMTWNPEIDDPYVTFNMDQTIDSAMARGGEGNLDKLKHKFQKANGESQFIPEIAPLEFPTLDKMDLDPETQKKNDTMKEKARRKIEFAKGYRDKRAQARFVRSHPHHTIPCYILTINDTERRRSRQCLGSRPRTGIHLALRRPQSPSQ